MCFPKKKKKKHEKKSSTKAEQKQQQQKKRATTKNDELPNVHAEKVVDVFQSGARGETTARAEKENADRAASRKK